MKHLPLFLFSLFFLSTACNDSKPPQVSESEKTLAPSSPRIEFQRGGDDQSWWVHTNGPVKIEQSKFGKGNKSTMSLVIYLNGDPNQQVNHPLPLSSFEANGPFQMKVWGIDNGSKSSAPFSNTGTSIDHGKTNPFSRFEGGSGAEVEFKGFTIP